MSNQTISAVHHPAGGRMLSWPTASPDVVQVAKRLGRGRKLQPGDRLQTVGGPASAGVVVSGLLRGIVSSESGREATVLYAGPGAFLGEGIFYKTAVGTMEAMVPTVVYEIPAQKLATIRERNPELKLLLLKDLEEILRLLIAAVSEHAFGDLKTRLARHMLALARVDRGRSGWRCD